MYACSDWISEISGATLCTIVGLASDNLVEKYKILLIAQQPLMLVFVFLSFWLVNLEGEFIGKEEF